MLKLQSFVSELGQSLKGQAWLLVTGQQKLEDASEYDVLSKLKDRFPAALRVHLSTANIRDVVHQRLLKKDPTKLGELQKLFHEHRPLLKNFAYQCREIEEQDFLEVYPMVPEQIELLLQITTNLRSVSRRVQGDTHAVRGLLQLLGELFRAQKLADKPLGDLVTLDSIYDVLHTALEPDIQEAMRQLLDACAKEDLALASRAARAVALLQLIQDKTPTTRELVASCLYQRLGQGNQIEAVGEALELLRSKNLVEYTEKQGYKVQSSAGQEWQAERDAIQAPPDEWSKLIVDQLDFILAEAHPPKLGARPLPWAGLYSDGRKLSEVTIGKGTRDAASVQVEMRWPSADERKASPWVALSASKPDRLLVVAGEPQGTEEIARHLVRSQKMAKKYSAVKDSLRSEQHLLLHQEQTNGESLQRMLKEALAASFLDGVLYFRGSPFALRDHGPTFGAALSSLAATHVRKIYDQSIDFGAVTEKEFELLLKPVVSGIQQKFLEDGLGILSLENQKFVATCTGAAPKAIFAHISKQSGLLGSMLLAEFGAPPYGYPADVVKVCVLGLLRATRIRISPEGQPDITTITGPNVVDLFQLDRPFKSARLYVNETAPLDPRTRGAIARMLEEKLAIAVEREDGALFDAIWAHFPARHQKLRKVEAAFARMSTPVPIPEALTKLGAALEAAVRAPQIGQTLTAVKDHLDALRDGLALLAVCESELTDDAIRRVNALAAAQTKLDQLEAYGETAEVAKDAALVRAQLARPQPWVELGKAEAAAKRLHERYAAARTTLLGAQHQEVDGARARVKARENFTTLDVEQRNYVLSAFDRAEWETSAEDVAPSLVELRDRFPVRLEKERAESNQRMDRELERSRQTLVMPVDLALSGRELSARGDLDALLKEIEERVGPHLVPGKRVRLL
jgi:hypothetical protein